MNDKLGARIVLLLTVVVGVSVYLLRTVNLSLVVETVTGASIPIYFTGVATFFLTVPLRAKRWDVLLRDIDLRMPFRWLNGIVFLSLYLNTVLPAKSGDLYRGYKVAGEGTESTSTVLATIFVERVFDLVVLFGLLAVISLQFVQTILYDSTQLLTVGIVFAGVAALVGYLLAARLDYLDWVRQQVDGFRRGLRCIGSVRTFSVFFSLTLAVWGLNVVRISALARAIDINLGAAGVVLVAVVITILAGLPYTPAGIGIVEGVTTATLIGIGVSESAGLALVLLDRSITVVLVILVGSLYFLYSAETSSIRSIYENRRSEPKVEQE
ncbi:lysylphosphatidylglycerol synthase transmembrane domain-containing protein [Halorubrum distributum]|uniref:Flippase-like domain-containing protein n=1 Tax=Halorubrum distributum TaxID=29283 RepID=A0A6B1IJX6_9EURY|nr:lysylphosphatidylglycerol synthase transmembrane domain-containing protein [Halorubrum terrestre]MYL66707.1 flippase-like domain-containing protein [Halorubrum terrestre]